MPAVSFSTVTIFSLALAFGASLTSAQEQPPDQQSQQSQSVADAARQERARKEQDQKSAKHVYTNEDLQRSHILTPEDQAKVDARKNECVQDAQKNNCPPAPQQTAPGSLDATAPQQIAPGTQDANLPELSLGEIARQFRQQKELNALQPKQSEPFHLGLPATAFAAPILPAHPVIDLPTPPVLRPEAHSTFFRRDPFARVPARPRPELGNTSRLRPALRPRAPLAAPIGPKISPAPVAQEPVGAFASRNPARPSLRIEPVQPSAPQAHRRATLPATPRNLVPSVKPSAPLAVPSARPSVPFTPSGAVRPVAPRRPIASPSPAGPANLVPSVKPTAPLTVPGAKPAAPFASSEAVRPVAPRRPATASPSLAAPVLVAPAPAAKPAVPALSIAAPSAPVAGSVRVQPGDSLWKLALGHFGRGNAWPQILAANPGLADPNRLRIGATLTLPAANSAAAKSSAAKDGRTAITVHQGDTLWTLANSYLGHSVLWPCLASANPSLTNPDLIFAGQQLAIPAACTSPASRVRTEE